MNATKPHGLLASIEWVEAPANAWDFAIAEAIEVFCRASGIPCPADALFGTATWRVPAGMDLDPSPFCLKKAAPCLRVDMRDGTSFAVVLGWSNVCGCGECDGWPTFKVVESVFDAGKEVARG